MKITVIGTGYVGLVTGACFAEMGNDVVCLDVDPGKVSMLRAGKLPIYEPGLADIVLRNASAGRLSFTTDVDSATRHGVVQFVAVGTPPGEDGSADLQHVLAAARTIGQRIDSFTVVVDKSTVPVGTADAVRNVIAGELALRGATHDFAVVSNPEFLKEGAAVQDFMRPDRVVIGAADDRAIGVLRTLYAPFVRNHDRMLVMDIRSAELTKYAANAMLATRISFMNELSRLAERLGADIELVRQGIGSDPRIGFSFLYAGCGYGGSCFPKDVSALARTAAANGVEMPLLSAVERVNEVQKQVLVEKITSRFGQRLDGMTFAVWGLAFKPNTDDMREAPSRVLVESLCSRGARVRAYDPVAAHEAERALCHLSGFSTVPGAYEALEGATALVLVTEWKEFRTPDLDRMRQAMSSPVVFDGRNVFEPGVMRQAGFEYFGIGRG
jgi:UDPglucose 6-dehydrogenase